jgi:hypothetical protein
MEKERKVGDPYDNCDGHHNLIFVPNGDAGMRHERQYQYEGGDQSGSE